MPIGHPVIWPLLTSLPLSFPPLFTSLRLLIEVPALLQLHTPLTKCFFPLPASFLSRISAQLLYKTLFRLHPLQKAHPSLPPSCLRLNAYALQCWDALKKSTRIHPSACAPSAIRIRPGLTCFWILSAKPGSLTHSTYSAGPIWWSRCSRPFLTIGRWGLVAGSVRSGEVLAVPSQEGTGDKADMSVQCLPYLHATHGNESALLWFSVTRSQDCTRKLVFGNGEEWRS